MKFVISLWVMAFAPIVHAVPHVDPTAIEADGPEMLEPAAFYSFCGPDAFVMSLDPVQLRNAADKSQGEEVKHPLDGRGGTKVIDCKQGEHNVVATLQISPPHESGMCAAVHYVGVKFRVDNQMLLTTKFAEYCAPWGLTSFALLGYSRNSSSSTLRVCGYWSEQVAVGQGKGILEKKSFECADFSAQEMVSRKLYVTDGPQEVHSLE